MPPYIVQRQTYACQAFPMEHIMKQHNAYKMVDQTTKQTMGLKTPLLINSHIHQIKKKCTTHIIILFSVHKVIQSIYNKVHLHSSAASISELDHPAPQLHGKIQSCYPPVCYIQMVLLSEYIPNEYCFLLVISKLRCRLNYVKFRPKD